MLRKVMGNMLMLIGMSLVFSGGLITGDLKRWPTERDANDYARDMRWRYLQRGIRLPN